MSLKQYYVKFGPSWVGNSLLLTCNQTIYQERHLVFSTGSSNHRILFAIHIIPYLSNSIVLPLISYLLVPGHVPSEFYSLSSAIIPRIKLYPEWDFHSIHFHSLMNLQEVKNYEAQIDQTFKSKLIKRCCSEISLTNFFKDSFSFLASFN